MIVNRMVRSWRVPILERRAHESILEQEPDRGRDGRATRMAERAAATPAEAMWWLAYLEPLASFREGSIPGCARPLADGRRGRLPDAAERGVTVVTRGACGPLLTSCAKP